MLSEAKHPLLLAMARGTDSSPSLRMTGKRALSRQMADKEKAFCRLLAISSAVL